MDRESSESGHSISLRGFGLIVAAATVGIAAYVLASAWSYRLGFPLDDSWIHATYARNLAQNREWAFQLGQPSAGSTAPLWTLLLVPGYWIGLAPPWWSHILGLSTLLVLGVVAEAATRRLIESYRSRIPWVGLFVVSEWHMLWAAASGMETLLHATLATVVLAMLLTGSREYAALGLLTGLSVWVRPDGLTLVGPVLVALFVSEPHGVLRLRGLASYLLGLGALLVPYLAFNLWLSGTPMPNTFYAKQAEYAAWQARPLLYRIGVGVTQLSTGSYALLWPGLIISMVRMIRTRNIVAGAAVVWCISYLLMYLLRLPAYQHGRYLMPAMPMLIILGILGFFEFRRSSGFGTHHWAVAWAWQSGLLLLSVGFLWLGARAYGEDVAMIETEMVDTAVWVAERIPLDAVIAAHDIGALGYFDRHALIDLAGLVSPEVLPFIRDEARLAEFLDRRGAQYLIAFPHLYPRLAENSEPVYSSDGQYAPAAGVGNMTVYCWRCP
ncbi:MAG: hypothetical protein V1755_15855 [Chloroflexota bacterium]